MPQSARRRRRPVGVAGRHPSTAQPSGFPVAIPNSKAKRTLYRVLGVGFILLAAGFGVDLVYAEHQGRGFHISSAVQMLGSALLAGLCFRLRGRGGKLPADE